MNLLNETGENLLSVYDDGYKEGSKQVLELIMAYKETEILSLQSKIVIDMLLEHIWENVNNA